MSGGSWPLPAGSCRPPRVGKTGRGRGEGKPGPGVPPWGWAWRRGPVAGGAGEGGFPPGGGARPAGRAEAPGRGRSTPRPLGARWAEGGASGAGASVGRRAPGAGPRPGPLRATLLGASAGAASSGRRHPAGSLCSARPTSRQSPRECRGGQSARSSEGASQMGVAGHGLQPACRRSPVGSWGPDPSACPGRMTQFCRVGKNVLSSCWRLCI